VTSSLIATGTETRTEEAAPVASQFVQYLFLKVDPQWRRLGAPERTRGRAEFAEVVTGAERSVTTYAYSTLGLKTVMMAGVIPRFVPGLEGNRAGPTLHGVFGRRIATLPGYNFSPALKKLGIVWTPETVSKLFEIGPMTYTPGTKMPEQTIGSAEDRKALVQFLEKATAK